MNKYPEKIKKLAEIMGISPHSVVLGENEFDIQETYCDQSGIVHYKVVLRTGEEVFNKKIKK